MAGPRRAWLLSPALLTQCALARLQCLQWLTFARHRLITVAAAGPCPHTPCRQLLPAALLQAAAGRQAAAQVGWAGRGAAGQRAD